MNDIVRRPAAGLSTRASFADGARRGLARLQAATELRIAAVQAEGFVQQAKLQELDHLGREAALGQALLRNQVELLSAGDPFAALEYRYFTDLVRLGKGEVIADTINSYCRESRR